MNREDVLIQGTVAAIRFQNPENGYSVILMQTDDGNTITVVGTIPQTVPGERLIITGRWSTHSTYGPQFEAEFLERLMPETKNQILAFLSSRAVRGIGAKTAAKIVERFGTDSLDIIENDPAQLATIGGISQKKAEEISESFRRQSGVRRLIEFLMAHHLPAELGIRLFRVYGDMAQDALRDDPYLLTDPFFHADFSLVDTFAQEMDISAEDERRVEAGILFELSYNLGYGHVFIPLDKLIPAAASLLNLPSEIIEEGTVRLHEQQRMITDEICGIRAAYLPEFYDAETFVAKVLSDMAETVYPEPRNLSSMIREICRQKEIEYAPQQTDAIRFAATRRVLVVTGGPGTGKTTVMAGILDLFDRMKLKTVLAAPTGRAAKRLCDVTGRKASTVHRLLEVQYDELTGSMKFYHDESEPLNCDAIILDEASMMDLQLTVSLLRALKPGCRLILVGDPDQLPSVGAGNVFSDIIRSETVQTVRLTQIFRQAQESLIVMNAHAIIRGEMPELGATDKDFFFIKRKTPESAVQLIQDLCSERLPGKLGIAPSEIQVLSPTKKYETGTRNLNNALQAVLNPTQPGKREKKIGEFILREGDRVMQIRNNYDIIWRNSDTMESGTGIFNGDVGILKEIDFESESATVQFDDRMAEYPFENLNELEPAYAVTVHKSQGSEYRAVVLSAFTGSRMLLTRSVLYTAVTRAKEMLIIVGNEEVLAAMVANNRQQKRYSGLKVRLEQFCSEYQIEN